MAITKEEMDMITESVISRITPDITKNVISHIKEQFFLVPLTTNFNFRKEAEFIQYVIFEVANYFQVDKELLVSNRKIKVEGFDYSFSQLRFMIMNLCREIPDRPISYPTIKESLKLKHHSGVIYGVRNCQDLLKDKTQKAFQHDYTAVKNKIKSHLQQK